MDSLNLWHFHYSAQSPSKNEKKTRIVGFEKEVIVSVNVRVRGWIGYFHYANSADVR